MFLETNPNPLNKKVGDCTVRALSLATGESWDGIFTALCAKGYETKDMPSANAVWGACLSDKGWARHSLPDNCPSCYTVKQFAADHRDGRYIVACDGHVVAVIDGTIIDTWDSGDLTALAYWEEEK